MASLAVKHVIELLYYHDRPFVYCDTLLIREIDNSFPSGHAAAFFGFSLAFIQTGHRKTGITLLGLAILNSIGRIYIGFHYPLDILAGLLSATIGLAVVNPTKKYFDKITRLTRSIENRIFEFLPRSSQRGL